MAEQRESRDEDIRDATAADVEAIKALAVATEMFAADEVGFFEETLGGIFDGSLEGHRWLVLKRGEDGIAASAYYAPEPFADRMWNLYFLAVAPTEQGRGTGGALVEFVEAELRALGDAAARTLIVETSSTPKYETARAFYRRQGFAEEARIRQFYGPTDDKIVFWKSLRGAED